MRIHKQDVSLNCEEIVDDSAAFRSRMEPLSGWPIVPLSQMAREKVAIITLRTHDLTPVKRRQFYEPL